MLDPSFPLQQALVARLKNHVDGIADRVYDNPPDNRVYPYITLGDCQVLPDKADCIDGAECFPIVDVWSREVGYPQAKQIAGRVLALLDDQPLSVEGFEVIVFEILSYQPLRDPDGLTRRVSLTFRSLINPI